MPITNIQFINYYDDQNQLVDKLNNNFDEVVEFHGGTEGNPGPTGERGPIGEKGKAGATGVSGPRGTRWFIKSTGPTGLGNFVSEGDYWINSTDSSIYIFNTTGWVDTGYDFNSIGSLFSLVSSTFTGYTGVTGSSLIMNVPNPDKYTFVLSDNSPESSIINETLSKFYLSTDVNNSGSPLEFSKSNLEDGTISDYSKHPLFKWSSLSTNDNSIVLDVPGGVFNMGASGGLDSSFNSSSVKANNNININYGASGNSGIYSTGGYEINSPSGNFNFVSNFLNITGASGRFSNPVTSISTIADSISSVSIYGLGASGFISSRSGDSHSTLSSSVYHLKLENNTETVLSLDTRGNFKTSKVEEGVQYPNNTPAGVSGGINWYIISTPYADSPSYTPLSSGNVIVFSPSIVGATSQHSGLCINNSGINSWASPTGGILPGESVNVNVFSGADIYGNGYWETVGGTSGGANYTGFRYLGIGSTASSVTTKVTFDSFPQQIDMTITRGVTGPYTTVFYKAYSTGYYTGVTLGVSTITSGYFSF